MTKLKPGDLVSAEGEQGRIVQIGGKRPDTSEALPANTAWVAWEQGVCTPCPLADLTLVKSNLFK